MTSLEGFNANPSSDFWSVVWSLFGPLFISLSGSSFVS